MRSMALGVLLFLLPQAAHAQAPAAEQIHSKYSETDYAELKAMIETVEPEQMDLDFFKKVYRYDHAPEMMKSIFSNPKLEKQSNRLAELRKFYDWSIQAEYARKNFVVIENTNQGKANGARSDLDATANILDFDPATGQWGLRKQVKELIDHQKARYKDGNLTPDGVDVTLFNGDVFLPDWRDARLGFHEFKTDLVRNTYELKQRKGAYYVPGANKEQTHDRALAEGHTVHIGWDYFVDRPTVNGKPFEFDAKTGEVVWLDYEYDKVKGEYQFKRGGPIEELITQEAAAHGDVIRYAGVEALPPSERWRRALGNIVQNTKEFFEPHDPVGRNKYFIERLIDQGVGRFTQLDPAARDAVHPAPESVPEELRPEPTYVQIHGAKRVSAEEKAAWKKTYIQQAFGLANGDPRIAELQSVLDRSADIQLDKTQKRASYDERAKHAAGKDFYFQEEWNEAVRNVSQRSDGTLSEQQLTRLYEKEAERLFVEKQRKIIPEAAVRVLTETFQNEMNGPKNGQFLDPEVQSKIMLERGVEISLLLDVIEASPLPLEQRNALRQRVVEAIPESVRPLVLEIADLVGIKMGLAGRQEIGLEEYTSEKDTLSERWEETLKKLGIDSTAPSASEDAARQAFREAVHERLGPVEAAQFEEAWKAGKTALISKFGAKAYWNEITEQVDGMMLTGAALGLINAYEQNCIGQTSWNETCLTGLAAETGNQVLYMLPGINTGFMITNGLKQIGEGQTAEGVASLGLGAMSIPQIASAVGASGGLFVHIYVGYQMLKTAKAVTYGYAMQTMENDAVDQAFKAIREPGKQARPFPAANRSTVFTGDTPTFPLLSDVITGKGPKGQDWVPAENYSDAERNRTAAQQSAPAIDSELKELGLKEKAPDWEAKRRELIVRYGMMLPYLQRTAKIYQFFGPEVAAQGTEADDLMPACLDRIDEDVEHKQAESPGVFASIRSWWNKNYRENERQSALAAGWSECVERTLKADQAILAPVFDRYLDRWFRNQSAGYIQENETPQFRARLRAALMREYVVHRYMDQGYENERQMKRALAAAKQQSKTKLELMGKLVAKQQDLAQQVAGKLSSMTATTRPAAKPQLTLRAAPFAVRSGDPAFVEVAVRGEYGGDATQETKDKGWTTDLDSEVTKVSLGAPDNIIVTPELRRELTPDPGKKPKRVVTIEQKIKAQLKDGAGGVVATAEASALFYDVIEWQGAIGVEVRAAGPDTKDATDDKQTFPYPYALVKLSGPKQAQKESEPSESGGLATANFVPLPEGKYSIHVQPRSTDLLHKPADEPVELAGISMGSDDAGKPVIMLGDGAQSVLVVLPYTPLRANPVQQTQAGRPPQPLASNLGTNPASGPKDPDAPGPDPQKDVRTVQIKHLSDTLQQQTDACDYADAIATLRELAGIDPANASLANLPRLERMATAKANIESLLADAANPANDAEARDTLARLRQSQADAPPCMGPEIAMAVTALEHRLAVRDRITAALAACDYVKALAAALELQTIAPDDEWLAANLGQLQAVAAEQSNALMLIRQAQASPVGPEAAALAGRLRQSLSAAPACMAGQIQTAIAGLEQGQKPAWLDAGTQPGSQTSATDNLNHARDILQQNTQDETDHQNRPQPPKLQEEPTRTPVEPPSKGDEQAHQKPDPPHRRDNAQRTQETLTNLAGTIGTILSGGKIPLPPTAAGGRGAATSPADPFAGTWACRGSITSQRNVKVQVRNPTSVIRISKSATGYVMESNSGPVPSTSISGNHIVFSARVGRSDSWQATTDDLSATGSQMTGTEQMSNSDGALVVASLDCNRQ